MVLNHTLFKTAIGHKLPDHPVTASKHWIEVKDVMTTDIATISAGEYVTDAAKIMAERNISCIIVTDNGTMKGILTERDLVKTVAEKKKHHTKMKVSSVMSSDVISVSPHFSVLKASKRMGDNHIRRLPVIEEKKLVGVVTQTDLTRALTSYGLWSSVEDIMTKDVAKVQDTAPVSEAAKIMAKAKISCILCIEKDKVSGIISERDMIKKVVALKKDPSKIHVKEIMSSPVIDAHPSLSVFSAGRLMERMNIRRLVIMKDRQLIGIITQTDIFHAIKKKLHDEEEIHLKLLEKSEYCVYTSTLDGIITYVNPAFMKLFKVTDQKVFLNKPFLPPKFWLNPKDREEFIERHKRAFINSEELSLVNSKGKKIYLIISSSFTKDIHGKINGIQGLVRDITQEKDIVSLIEAQESLRQSEEKYRSLVENIQDGVFLIQDGKLKYVNEAFARIPGYTVEEITNMDFNKLVAPEDLKMVADRYKKMIAGQKVPAEYEFHGIRKNEDIRTTVNMTASLINYQGKKAVLGIVKDITERKKAEETLRQSDENLKMVLDNTNDMVVYVDRHGRILSINKRVEETLDCKPEDIIGRNFAKLDVIKLKNIPQIIKLFKDSLRTGKITKVLELELKDKNNNEILVEASTKIIEKNGKSEGAVSILRDITERKKFETEKEDYTEKLRERTVELEEKTADLEQANTKLNDAQDKLNSQIGLLERFKKATIDDVLEMKKIGEENEHLRKEIEKLKR